MSRYPSAYGHTPSYRSVGSMPAYPSALGSRDADISLRSGLSSTSALSSDIDREFSAMKSSMLSDPLKYDPLAKTGSKSSSYQASSSYSSSEVRSSDGGIPHRSSHSDSTYKSVRAGDSGIPHTSYSHTSSNFDSDRPYGNRVSSFSYNI